MNLKQYRTFAGSTLVLKAVIILIGLLVLTLCVLVLPAGIRSDETTYYRPILFGMYFTAIPFFIALVAAFKLLRYVDLGQAFSTPAVKKVRNIKYCAFIISGLYAAGMPYIYYAADRDDAPGVVALGLVIIFASTVIAAATAILQKLLQSAVTIKSENDLTV